MAIEERLTFGSSTPDDLRRLGWKVAVHNDYRLGGEDYTFWLLTKQFPGERSARAVKGEGRTDANALDQVRTELKATD